MSVWELRLAWAFAIAFIMLIGVSDASGQNIVTDGQSEYQIVLGADASASEQSAAQELKAIFLACTGADLPLVEGLPKQGIPMIVLGRGAVARSLAVDPSPEALGEQGYVLRTVDRHLVIAGTSAAGTMYGVYDFLEEFLGVRWYAPGVTHLPKQATVALPQVDRLVTPSFASRHSNYRWSNDDPRFRIHQRDNGGGGGPEDASGTQYAFDGRCHSYFRYISPDEFFDSHPEYFSEVGGVRRREDTQLCLTNPDVLDIVTERILARMAARPGDRQHNFSQMDWYNYCECDRCAAVNAEHGSLGATQFLFVNKLAERTAAVYPDKLIGTLAYTYTEEPPTDLPIHPNVAIWLCHMFPSCDSHPIATCPLDGEYKRRALAWSDLSSHLYIWHYTVDYAHYFAPFPNFRAMAADMRFYRDIGVEGMFLQAGDKGGEFNLLRPYYGLKLLWNPDQDPDALLRDFLRGYYGDAAPFLWKYFVMIHDKVENEAIHMHLYTNPAQGYLPDGLLRHADRLFDEAEGAVAEDEVLLDRVREARLPLTYARLFPRNGYKIEDEKLIVQGDVASVEDATHFLAQLEKYGYRAIREWGGDPRQLMAWATFLNNPVPVERLDNGHLLVDVVPAFGGRALRIIHKDSAQCITAYNTTQGLYYPFSGGEATRLGTLYRTPGNTLTTYTVVSKTATSIVLESENAMGFGLRRTLTLAPDEPVLTVRNEVTNIQDKAATLIGRSHVEFDLGDLMKSDVSFSSQAGTSVMRGMEPIVAGLREGESYRGDGAPNGTWTFRGTKGLQVTQTFDPDQIDFTWLYAFPQDLNTLESELWMKPKTLAPGEQTSFGHEIAVHATAE